MGKLLVIPVIIACLPAGSIILIAIKRIRKIGLSVLGICISNPICKGVTFRGFSDDRCWMDEMKMFFLKLIESYLFDAELNPKPAFHEIYKTFKLEYESRNLR